MSKQVFQHSLHKALWLWLAENPDKAKSEWPRWVQNGEDIESQQNGCFACQYRYNSNFGTCDNCPLIWSKNAFDEKVCDGEVMTYELHGNLMLQKTISVQS